MDNLNEHLEQSLNERTLEIPRVESILIEEQAKFMEYFASLNTLPLIADLRQHAEMIRQMELEKSLRRMPDLSDEERGRIEALDSCAC